MGCWTSKIKHKADKDATFDGIYVAITPPTRGLSKRLWRSRNSYASSSGISSGCNTPLRGSKAFSSRSSSPEMPSSEYMTPEKKLTQRQHSEKDLIYENLPAFLKNVPLDIDMDDEKQDFSSPKQHINAEVIVLDESGGYYTDESSDCSSLPKRRILTRNGCEELDLDDSDLPDCELDMEMQMMNKAYGIMPKTSSPVFQRRDATFEIPAVTDVPLPPPSASYQKWRKYLQMTPTYALYNLTNLPEAIAGRFCPSDFPGYTEVRAFAEELAIMQHHHQNHCQEAAETIIMELPVPTVTTEL